MALIVPDSNPPRSMTALTAATPCAFKFLDTVVPCNFSADFDAVRAGKTELMDTPKCLFTTSASIFCPLLLVTWIVLLITSATRTDT